jgi:hypothetical protein
MRLVGSAQLNSGKKSLPPMLWGGGGLLLAPGKGMNP